MPNETTTSPKNEVVEQPVTPPTDAVVQPVANTEDNAADAFVMPTFEDAEVPTVSRPRSKAPNPFAAVVSDLAERTTTWSKANEDTRGKQPAKAFPWPTADVNKARRQLSDAGNDLETPVTVKWSTAEIEGTENTRVTIWVVDKQRRPGAGNHGKKSESK